MRSRVATVFGKTEGDFSLRGHFLKDLEGVFVIHNGDRNIFTVEIFDRGVSEDLFSGFSGERVNGARGAWGYGRDKFLDVFLYEIRLGFTRFTREWREKTHSHENWKVKKSHNVLYIGGWREKFMVLFLKKMDRIDVDRDFHRRRHPVLFVIERPTE